ncbi:MAG: alpha/beta hydrolase [Methylohalobius crimeensis]
MKTLERKLKIDPKRKTTSLWAVPEDYDRQLAVILAHGAGSDMHHPFLSFVQESLAERGVLTVKFNFPYKEEGRKAPDRMLVLLATWKAVVDAVRNDPDLAPQRIFLAGKSMGGRAASMLAAEGEACAGLIFLGYPLHPPDKPDKPRTEHLPRINCSMLFIQGTRDRLCDLERLRPVLDTLSVPVDLHVIEGGDHSFKVLKRLGRSEGDVWKEIVEATADWINALPKD